MEMARRHTVLSTPRKIQVYFTDPHGNLHRGVTHFGEGKRRTVDSVYTPEGMLQIRWTDDRTGERYTTTFNPPGRFFGYRELNDY